MGGFPNIEAEDRAFLETARDAATRAVEVHRRATRDSRAQGWHDKGRADFVTEVDLEAERRIVDTIGTAFPDHAIMAEEGSIAEGSLEASVGWLIDPLDGTTNWMHGYPEYSVSIAALDSEGLRVAIVVNSVSGERFEAVRGAGARRDDEPIGVSILTELEGALVGTGFPFKKLELLPAYLETFGRVISATSGVRRAGVASLDLCDLACGRLDAFWELWLMPWDVAAGALMVEEAGGAFMRLELPATATESAGEDVEDRAAAPLGAERLRAGGFLATAPGVLAEFRAVVEGRLSG
jgi:myo-inositol-1(or 4)-monophosphatase